MIVLCTEHGFVDWNMDSLKWNMDLMTGTRILLFHPSVASFRLVHLTLEVFPGDCIGLCLHNLVPGLASFI